MAETTSDTKTSAPEIPIFKERRMTGMSEAKLTESYFISSSYAGILRLSPNSSSTLLDLNDTINVTDDTKDYIYYADDPTLALESQFVTVSTSDGILLDMSIRHDAIQFNNLYVLGALSTSSMIIHQQGDNIFSIDGIHMPNTHLPEGTPSNNTPEVLTIEEKIFSKETFEFPDDYYLLYNKAEDGEATSFNFESIKTLVEKITNEALNELNQLPTGSIHWVPVKVDQYNKLLGQGSGHNSDNADTPTLIRDFLLCDGSIYDNKDYPELAKILKGERIVYWDKERWLYDAKRKN